MLPLATVSDGENSIMTSKTDSEAKSCTTALIDVDGPLLDCCPCRGIDTSYESSECPQWSISWSRPPSLDNLWEPEDLKVPTLSPGTDATQEPRTAKSNVSLTPAGHPTEIIKPGPDINAMRFALRLLTVSLGEVPQLWPLSNPPPSSNSESYMVVNCAGFNEWISHQANLLEAMRNILDNNPRIGGSSSHRHASVLYPTFTEVAPSSLRPSFSIDPVTNPLAHHHLVPDARVETTRTTPDTSLTPEGKAYKSRVKNGSNSRLAADDFKKQLDSIFGGITSAVSGMSKNPSPQRLTPTQSPLANSTGGGGGLLSWARRRPSTRSVSPLTPKSIKGSQPYPILKDPNQSSWHMVLASVYLEMSTKTSSQSSDASIGNSDDSYSNDETLSEGSDHPLNIERSNTTSPRQRPGISEELWTKTTDCDLRGVSQDSIVYCTLCCRGLPYCDVAVHLQGCTRRISAELKFFHDAQKPPDQANEHLSSALSDSYQPRHSKSEYETVPIPPLSLFKPKSSILKSSFPTVVPLRGFERVRPLEINVSKAVDSVTGDTLTGTYTVETILPNNVKWIVSRDSTEFRDLHRTLQVLMQEAPSISLRDRECFRSIAWTPVSNIARVNTFATTVSPRSGPLPSSKNMTPRSNSAWYQADRWLTAGVEEEMPVLVKLKSTLFSGLQSGSSTGGRLLRMPTGGTFNVVEEAWTTEDMQLYLKTLCSRTMFRKFGCLRTFLNDSPLK